MSFAGLRFVLALGFAMAAAALPIGEQAYQSEFVSFVTAFDKRYSTAEFFQRFAIFKHNYDTILRHNSGNHSWTMGVNQFSDLTDAEFAARFTSPLNRGPREQSATTHEAPVRVRELAAEKDWRKEGAVTPVKNQGDCNAQWAFAATGLVEGWVYTQKKVLYSFSEQQLFDCSQIYGTEGCIAGWPDAALQYLRDEFVYDKNGACLSSEYPFTGKIGTCKTCRAVGQFSELKDLRSSSALFDAAIEKAPIAFALAFPAQLKKYKSGIFSGPCPGDIGGFLLLVGYGTESGTEYWIAKNAWGPSWGEQGYVRFRRHIDICGMESWGWTITQ